MIFSSTGSHPRSLSRMSFASVGSQLSALGTSRYEASRRLQIHRSDTVAAFPSVGGTGIFIPIPSSDHPLTTAIFFSAISGRSIHSRRGQEAAAFSSTPSSQSTFVMPAEPPSKDQWVPDSEASVCMVCNVERFTMVGSWRSPCRGTVGFFFYYLFFFNPVHQATSLQTLWPSSLCQLLHSYYSHSRQLSSHLWRLLPANLQAKVREPYFVLAVINLKD